MKRILNDKFIFQQHSALMLIAFNTVQLLQCKTHIFICFWPSGQWPQNGPELNSNDDEI